MQTELVDAPTVVDHVPTLQYEHSNPAVAAKVPALQGLQKEAPRDHVPAGQVLHVNDATSR